jgi:hypothetical protein
VLDRVERTLDLGGAQVLRDLESGQRMSVVPATVRGRYCELIEQHIAQLNDACIAHGIEFVCLGTAQPLDHALFHFLARRGRSRDRGRSRGGGQAVDHASDQGSNR